MITEWKDETGKHYLEISVEPEDVIDVQKEVGCLVEKWRRWQCRQLLMVRHYFSYGMYLIEDAWKGLTNGRG